MADLLREWATSAVAREITDWAHRHLPNHGTRPLPFALHRLRFWSAVFRADAPDGPLWCKVNNPGQAFEAALVTQLTRTPAAAHITEPLATDPDRGLLLYPDYGPTIRAQAGPHRPTTGPAEALALAPVIAAFQHQTTLCKADLLKVGLSAVTPETAPDLITDRIRWHTTLPETNPQHLNTATAKQLTAQLPDFAAAMTALAQSGVPYAVQPNDAHGNNAFPDATAPLGLRLHDFGDALWSHPFAVLDSLLCTAEQNPLVTANTPPLATNPIVTTYLSYWPRADTELIRPALRLGQLHRYEAWRRLLLQVPYQDAAYHAPPISQHLHAALTG